MNIFMIGICGTAMANLASMLSQIGHSVMGSDENIYPPMSDFLKQRQIKIFGGFEEKIPKKTDLVIIGNAVSRGNPQAEQALREKMKIASMPQVIGEAFLNKTQNIVVTGTHGKTTTTAMLVAILRSAGLDPGFLIGGISSDLGTGSHIGSDPLFVIEGDEYDSAFFDKRSKFVHYAPDILIINNIEFDHGDIFRDLADIKRSFRQVVNIVPDNGLIVVNGDDNEAGEVCQKAPAPINFFGKNDDSKFQFKIKTAAKPLSFSLAGMDISISNIWGEHNAYNASAAATAALHLGIKPTAIVDGLGKFSGVKRRMQKIGQWKNGAEFYQDFAHHPTAIKNTLLAFRQAFADKRLVAVVEPRSNTMVRNFLQKELIDALSNSDYVYLGLLHRLQKIPKAERLDKEKVLMDLKQLGIECSKEENADNIFEALKKTTQKDDIVLIMSNGSFDGLIENIANESNLSE